MRIFRRIQILFIPVLKGCGAKTKVCEQDKAEENVCPDWYQPKAVGIHAWVVKTGSDVDGGYMDGPSSDNTDSRTGTFHCLCIVFNFKISLIHS